MLSVIEVFEKTCECRSEVFVDETLRVHVIVCTSRDVKIAEERKLYFFEIGNSINKNLKFLSRTLQLLPPLLYLFLNIFNENDKLISVWVHKAELTILIVSFHLCSVEDIHLYFLHCDDTMKRKQPLPSASVFKPTPSNIAKYCDFVVRITHWDIDDPLGPLKR